MESKSLITDSSDQQTNDETLMLAYADGDAAAFEQLYHKHKVVVYRFFVKQYLPLAVAEELTHDTWLKIINARDDYVVTAKFTTYLFTIARRLAIDYHNKKSNRCEVSKEDELVQASSTIQNTHADENKNRVLSEALTQQIALLPFEQREVFLLKQEAGFNIDDIAKITGEKKEKIKSRWRYALKKLREGLSGYVN